MRPQEAECRDDVLDPVVPEPVELRLAPGGRLGGALAIERARGRADVLVGVESVCYH